MRKKWISFLGGVCVLCLHAIPSSAEQLTLSELYQMADSQSLVIRVAESELVAANHGVQQAKNALVNARIGLIYNYYQLKYITHSL